MNLPQVAVPITFGWIFKINTHTSHWIHIYGENCQTFSHVPSLYTEIHEGTNIRYLGELSIRKFSKLPAQFVIIIIRVLCMSFAMQYPCRILFMILSCMKQGHSKQKNYGVLLKQLAPSPSRRRCEIAKVRMRKCKGARAKVRSEMDTPIASSPLQLYNLVFALSPSSFSFRLVDYL